MTGWFQVNRNTLDFDFEKLCSVCLSNIHVYGCLVCGKYFQGRGKNSYAFAHSVAEDHHVFINLETGKVSPVMFIQSIRSECFLVRSTFCRTAI